jgi:hypothetical protein
MLKRVCLHYTAGGLNPNSVDMAHYHFLADGKGVIHSGKHRPEANIPPLRQGRYAAHCGEGNSHTIGIALCGGPPEWKHGEIRRVSWEAAALKTAELCKLYNIPVTEDTVYTHHEFGLKNPRTSSRGKIDINKLPWDKKAIPGNVFRSAVKWYLARLTPEDKSIQSPIPDKGN